MVVRVFDMDACRKGRMLLCIRHGGRYIGTYVSNQELYMFSNRSAEEVRTASIRDTAS
jgi:hypothetical protein